MIPNSDDFYVEKGKFVWTEKFLLNRGYCCNNNCRHCPYNKIEKQEPKINDNLNKTSKEIFWLSSII